MAADTACSRSASSNTSSGDLPPSSIVTRLREPAAVCITFLPVDTEPVSDTLATPGCSASSAPVLPRPCSTLNTPGGTPASR